MEIRLSGETSSPMNKLGRSRRNDAAYSRKDQLIDSAPDGPRYAATVRFAEGFVAAAATSESGQKGRTPASGLPDSQIVDQSCYVQMMLPHYATGIKAPAGRGGKWARRRYNARPRVAQSMKKFFESAEVEVLPWPGSPPDRSAWRTTSVEDPRGFWATLKSATGGAQRVRPSEDRQRYRRIPWPAAPQRRWWRRKGVSSLRAGDSLMDVGK